MPVYDYQCEDPDCGCEFEVIIGIDELVDCPICGFNAKRLITASGVPLFNQDAEWIRSVTEVVDKESHNPAAIEFLRRPTRDNMHNWMRSEGIRHHERGEPLRPKVPDTSSIEHEVMRRYSERHA